MKRFALLFALCSLPVTFASSAEWSQFRGAGGNASTDESVPTKWSATENIVWKTKLPGRGASSAAIWKDRIFLTAYTGYGVDTDNPGAKADLKLHTMCFDRVTGKQLWDRQIPGGEHTQNVSRRVADHGFATGTPATDGEFVYAYFGVNGLVAYDMEGNPKWHKQTGTGTAGFGSASSPVVFGDMVYVNASIESKTLFAFDKKTGKEVWKKSPINRAWTTPCIATPPGGTPELIINQKDVVWGLDPATGEQLWTCDAIDDYIVPVPITHEGIAYLLGGRSNRCLAIKLGGRGDVTKSHKLWQVNIGANVTSPVYYKGHLYWSSDKSVANCMDAATGESIYRERMPVSGRIYASMIRAGDYLYASTRDKGILVLPAKPEYKELAVNQIETDENLINASPAVSHGQMFLRTDAYLYCIGEKK